MLHNFKALNNLRVQGAIAGAIGGAAGFLLAEIVVAGRLDNITTVNMGQIYRLDAVFGALTGVCIGLALGAAEGLISGARGRLARGAGIGAAAGLIGGVLGILLGEMVYQPLKMICFVGRALAWGLFGAIIGAAEGLTRRSWRGLRSAALGGAAGGAIGGVAFDLVAMIVGLFSGGGTASRAIALTILGACIGLFIVLVQKAMADGWLKVLTGRAEGRDFFLDKPRLTMGRDERCDVPLFGDPQVQPQHALLTQVAGGYAVTPLGAAPVLVRDAPVQGQQALQHGDILTLGATRLIYRLRNAGPVPAAAPPPRRVPPAPGPTPPAPPRVETPPAPAPAVRFCPYCGGPLRPQARFCGTCGRTLEQQG